MKFSVNWLREFVDLPKNAEEIEELLTGAGVETENIETHGAKIDKVIVAQITASSRHPNADRLTVCEIAALTGKTLKSVPRDAKIDIKRSGITISAARECPFFFARKIDNVKIGPSPPWLRTKVESVGIRSINNIVDISNFVMLELGQPTHAFDADTLKGGINV